MVAASSRSKPTVAVVPVRRSKNTSCPPPESDTRAIIVPLAVFRSSYDDGSEAYNGPLKRVKESEKEFSFVVSELEKRRAIIGKKPNLILFEGKKGIDAVNEDVLREAKEILAYGSSELITILEWQSLDFLKKRLKLGIRWMGITDSRIKQQSFYKDQKYQKLTKLRIDDSLKEMPTWTYIYSNKVAILSFKTESFMRAVG